MVRRAQPKEDKVLSEKSSKAEILAAYDDLKEKAQTTGAELFAGTGAAKPSAPKPPQELSLDAIVGDVAGLKLHLTRALGEVERRLAEQWQRLESLRQAVAEAEARLKEMHGLDAAAVSLAALQARQQEEKQAFEELMAESRVAWEKEKRDHEAMVKERDAAEKKERAREEEEYQYQVKTKRQREKELSEAELEAKRSAFEEKAKARQAELAAREAAVASHEQELQELRRQVASFPKEIEAAVSKAAEEARLKTEERLKLEKLLLEKDVEKERELQKLNVAGLQEKVLAQEARIKSLEKDLKEALSQNQAVAARAIEGIAGMRHGAALPDAPQKEAAPENRR